MSTPYLLNFTDETETVLRKLLKARGDIGAEELLTGLIMRAAHELRPDDPTIDLSRLPLDP